MTYTLERLEDNDLVVLETDAGESITVPRAHVPLDAKEGDVLRALPWFERDGEARYRVDAEATERRKRDVAALRASLPRAGEGDLEL